ncbi:MAG: NHL repeat-containing protein, partial [Nitrospirales bacterium]
RGHIFIADSDNHRVQMLQVTGSKKNPMSVVTQSPPIIEFDKFMNAETGITDLVLTDQQGLFLLSHGKDRILRVDSTTQVFGKSGSQPGQFDEPRALAATNDGSLLVADTGNDRIQILGTDGSPVYQFGKSGNKTGQFDEPQGIAMGHNNLIYVADTENHRVQIFNKEAIFLSAFGQESQKITQKTPEHGKFDSPTALAINSENHIYVLDSKNHRVQEFTEEGQFIRQIGKQGQKSGQFLNPVDIAIDENDYLYVADQGNKRVQIFSPNGKLVFLFGASAVRKVLGLSFSFGTSKEAHPAKFNKVSAVTAAKGKLYVADHASKTVQVFRFYPSGLVKEERLYVIKSVFPPQESDNDPFTVANEAAQSQALSELGVQTGLSIEQLQEVSKLEGVETLSTGAIQVTISVPKKLIQQGRTKPQALPQQEKSPETEEFILQ